MLIDDILEEYDINGEEYGVPDQYHGEPLSYVIIAETEEFPQTGAEIVFTGVVGKLILRVLSVDDNVILKVECEKK